MVNIQATLRTAFYLCKNFSVAVLCGRNGNSYTVSKQICVYIHIFFRGAVRAKEIKKIGTAVKGACQGNLSACHFGDACHVPQVRQPCSRAFRAHLGTALPVLCWVILKMMFEVSERPEWRNSPRKQLMEVQGNQFLLPKAHYTIPWDSTAFN
jgi:hypothetical protein